MITKLNKKSKLTIGYIALETLQLFTVDKMIAVGVFRNNELLFSVKSAPTIFKTKEELEIQIYKYKKIRNELMKEIFYKNNCNGSFKNFKNKYWKFFKIEIKEVE
ncbi:hypothetical protein [uncultured Clostridium sp.]|uniref:hypothetical protein n=1 Tax=uncultured Clostridium sp. TaxID=59620 RepID=UPI002625D925|nr:hypothetical protein [uncultured Clostridium sp.]